MHLCKKNLPLKAQGGDAMHSFGWEPLPPEDYKKRTFQHLEDTMGYNVNVDTDKCVGCGECVDVCPVEVYEIKDGKSEPVNSEERLGCESCVEVCETSAITVEEA